MTFVFIKDILHESIKLGEKVSIRGWVKFNRVSGKIAFIELNDGSCFNNLQIVYKKESLTNFWSS